MASHVLTALILDSLAKAVQSILRPRLATIAKHSKNKARSAGASTGLAKSHTVIDLLVFLFFVKQVGMPPGQPMDFTISEMILSGWQPQLTQGCKNAGISTHLATARLPDSIDADAMILTTLM